MNTKVKDNTGNYVDKYRFVNGSLFEYCINSNAYVHCFTGFKNKTINSAIKYYEEQQQWN